MNEEMACKIPAVSGKRPTPSAPIPANASSPVAGFHLNARWRKYAPARMRRPRRAFEMSKSRAEGGIVQELRQVAPRALTKFTDTLYADPGVFPDPGGFR